MKEINLMFNPQKGTFATINNPNITKVSDVTEDMLGPSSHVLQDASSGYVITFPINEFQIRDKKCVRNFKGFMRRVINCADHFCMEVDATGDLNLEDEDDPRLWFIDYDGTNASIGITLEGQPA